MIFYIAIIKFKLSQTAFELNTIAMK